ncbi:MAG: TIGR01777 family oxidoreductase [Caldilinea sp.]|nr:TIGR01777 family oxidoreductase [Caldilinea sp.]MDW8442239.1 TIGR01777 family oxidoreductase [Caldilineaceae bacterium]
MRVIITGGTGLIGRRLSRALVAEGHEVIVLSRAPEKAKDMPAGVQLQKWDGKSAEGWGALADGAGAIVNLAGAGIADKRWSRERKREIRQSRLNAGKAVMEAIAAASIKPDVLIQASAVGYYGTHTGDAQVTESFSPGGDFLSKVCFDWEASTAAAKKYGVRRAVIRTGVVLSNEGGAFPKQILPFKLFIGGPVGSGKQWYPWIHIEDQVRAILFLIADERAEGPFNLCAPNPVTNKEFSKLIGEVLGRPSFLPAPAFALKLLFGEMAMILLEGQRAVPQRLLELGFQFKYETARAALQDLLGKPSPAGSAATKSESPSEEKLAEPARAGKE